MKLTTIILLGSLALVRCNDHPEQREDYKCFDIPKVSRVCLLDVDNDGKIDGIVQGDYFTHVADGYQDTLSIHTLPENVKAMTPAEREAASTVSKGIDELAGYLSN